jgi:hypothetical protein
MCSKGPAATVVGSKKQKKCLAAWPSPFFCIFVGPTSEYFYFCDQIGVIFCPKKSNWSDTKYDRLPPCPLEVLMDAKDKRHVLLESIHCTYNIVFQWLRVDSKHSVNPDAIINSKGLANGIRQKHQP